MNTIKFIMSVFLIIFIGCVPMYNKNKVTNITSVKIYVPPTKTKIIKAINIIIDDFERQGLYSKEKMYNTIEYNKFYSNHENCNIPKHNLEIQFTPGEWTVSGKRCIFSEHKKLKNMCLSGIFNGIHMIYVLDKEKIYMSSLAHEMLHYFQKYITGMKYSTTNEHIPENVWKKVVGYKKRDIGTANMALKKYNL